MQKLYKLHELDNIKINKNISKYLDPEYIYLPIDDVLFFEEKEYIFKNRVVLETDILDYTSSISGKLSGFDEMKVNNKKVNVIKIKNDYKERSILSSKHISFFDVIKKSNLKKKLLRDDINNIIINAIEDEPYTYTESYVLNKNIDHILDTIETLSEEYDGSNIYITLKQSDENVIGKLVRTIGSYPNIKLRLLDNLYLIGMDEFLLERLNLSNNDTIVITPSEVLEVRNYSKFGYSRAEKYISLINLVYNKVEVINLKKYISVKELLEKYKVCFDNYTYLKNGLMSGKIIDINSEIVDDSFNSIIIVDGDVLKCEDCINCGLCIKVCPYKKKKCISCSLCSYYCPSNRDVRGIYE